MNAEAVADMLEANVAAAKLWRRGKFKHVEDMPLPWLWSAAAVIRAARKVGWNKGAASLRSLVEGGWPIQLKLWMEGKAQHNLCKCAAAVGTLWHKLKCCELTREHREVECPKEVLKAGYASAWDPLYSRAVPGRPKDVQIPIELVWHDAADAAVEKCATGDVYTDGSAKGWFWRSSRAGWSFVVLDKEGKWR